VSEEGSEAASCSKQKERMRFFARRSVIKLGFLRWTENDDVRSSYSTVGKFKFKVVFVFAIFSLHF